MKSMKTSVLADEKKQQEITDICTTLAKCIGAYCPNNQQRTMAKKKLKNTLFWALKSIAADK